MGTVDYKNAQLTELAKVAKQELDARNRQVWREAVTKYENLASHHANFDIVRQYCGGALSMPAVDYLMAHCDDSGLDLTDEKPELIEAILDARQYPDVTVRRAHNGEVADVIVKGVDNERKRLQLLTRIQLIDRLAMLVKKEELSHYTAVELREGLARFRENEEKGRWYFGPNGERRDRLPKVHVPTKLGFVSAVDTATFLREIARKRDVQSREVFQWYCQRYGISQINEYLAS